MPDFLLSLKFIWPAVEITVALTVIALVFGFAFGLLLSVARVYGAPAPRLLAEGYGRVVRSLPPLVVIFIVYFCITSVLQLDELSAAAISLGACTAAYQAEIFRGAIQSLGAGQMQAARSLGMSRATAIRWVVVPQALRLAIPAWANEASIVLKDSSLASAVGVAELLRRAQYIGAANRDYLSAYLACGLIYFCLTFVTSRALDLAQKRYQLKI